MTLSSMLYELETVPDAGADAGGGAPAADTPVDTPAADATATTTDATADTGDAAAGGDDFDETQFWSMIDDRAEAIADARFNRLLQERGIAPQAGTPAAPAVGQADTPFDWNALDPLADNYGELLGQGIRSTIEQAVQGAFNPLTEAVTQSQEQQLAEQGNQIVNDIVHDTIARGTDLTDEGKALVRPITDIFVGQHMERYGNSPRAWEQAAEQAATYVRQIEEAAAARAVAQRDNHLSTLAGQNGEPGVSGAAAVVPGQPSRYPTTSDLLARHSRV